MDRPLISAPHALGLAAMSTTIVIYHILKWVCIYVNNDIAI